MTKITDDRGYNQIYAGAASTEVRMRRRARLLLSEMRRDGSVNILEIGCGTGEMAHWMAEQTPATILGTDLCAPFVKSASDAFRRPNLRYEVLDFNKAEQFKGETFDYIVGNGILHHLYHHLDDALANMRTLLKDRGKIIFLEPNYLNPYIYFIFTYPWLRSMAKLEPDEMAFTKRFITEKLVLARFNEIHVDYRDFLLPGIPTFLVQPSVVAGNALEKLPPLNRLAQSIFIRASKGNA